MSPMICTWLRVGAAGMAVDSTARGRDNATGACCTGCGRAAKIGAGCGPCCRNSALMRIASTAMLAIKMPTNSRGCWPMAAARRPAPAASLACRRRLRLRTFLHLDACRRGSLALGFELDRLDRRTVAFAVDRQTHGHPRAGAEPAADVHVAAVQTHQAFDDRQAETGAVVPPVIRCARLEKG